MTTLRQMGAKIGSRVRFIEDPEGQWRTVKTDAELDYEHLLPWVVEDNTRIEELEAKLAAEREKAFREGFGMAASLTPHVYEVMERKDEAWQNSRTRAAIKEGHGDES